jgi:DNA topoisomerase-3
MVRVLNVAEKNSVAREICNQLAGGRANQRRSGQGVYVAEFPLSLNNIQANMTVTAVRGHLTELDFPDNFKSWQSVDPSLLFTCEVKKSIAHRDLATNLRQLARESDWLILWLDCDREGEAIAFEVLDVCITANRNLRIFRAKFSALTRSDLMHALTSLGEPNRYLSDAVQARTEIDLRVGAAFTRFLTLRYQQRISGERRLVSFGGCQTVTLGFVVSRWLLRDRFVPEQFWALKLVCQPRTAGDRLTFLWNRVRLFDERTVDTLYHFLSGVRTATVDQWTEQPKSRWRPLPLNTLEMTKIAASHLRIPSHQCMHLAESLYGKGLISYPRTETEIFHESMDLRSLVNGLSGNSVWGSFASRLLQRDTGLYAGPRRGTKDDQAHPPIHPLKSAERSDFDNFDEYRVYELVCRHFLACLAKDAKGSASHVEVILSEGRAGVREKYHADGLTVLELNWLEIYPYSKWTSTAVLPVMTVGDQLTVCSLEKTSGQTEAPSAISEPELLTLMDKEGIGTDATMHEHIKTIQERGYCYMDGNRFFIPTSLGIALVLGLGSYEPLGFHLAKPTLRASMERDMALISQGRLTKANFISKYSRKMMEILLAISDNPFPLDSAIGQAVTTPPPPPPSGNPNGNGRGGGQRRPRTRTTRPRRQQSSTRRFTRTRRQ